MDRTQFVGASEVAALLGCHPYQDAYTLYQSKIDPPEDKDSDAKAFGNAIEPALIRWFADRTFKCKTTWHQKHLRLGEAGATYDTVLLDGDYKRRRFNHAPMDVKTIGFNGPLPYHDQYGRGGSEQVPPYVWYQVQQQLHIMHKSNGPEAPADGFVGLLDMAHPDKKKTRVYRIAYQPHVGEMLMDAIRRFWIEHVQAQVPPDPDTNFFDIGF